MRVLLPTVSLVLLLVGVALAADSLNVRQVGSCSLPHAAYGVTVAGDYAYVADADDLEPDSGGALLVVDVSDPQAPVQVGFCDLPGLAVDVAVVDSLAYVAAFDGLHVVDVTVPQNPQEVGHCQAAALAFSVEVVGSCAYVGYGSTDNWTGMCVVSISDPHNPQVVGSCGAPGIWGATVAVSGSHAFVANWEGGLRIIDVSNPQDPHEVASAPVAARGVAVRAGYAYVAADSQLYVLDVSNPLNPQQVGSCHTASSGWNVAVDGDYAYMSYGVGAGQPSGLRVVEITDPQHPQEVGYYETPGYATGVALGDYVYVARCYDGMTIYEFYGAGIEESVESQAAGHTPAATILSGASGVKRLASCVVFDAMGRRVVSPRSGVYFVRDEGRGAGEDGRVCKVIVQR